MFTTFITLFQTPNFEIFLSGKLDPLCNGRGIRSLKNNEEDMCSLAICIS